MTDNILERGLLSDILMLFHYFKLSEITCSYKLGIITTATRGILDHLSFEGIHQQPSNFINV